MFYQMSKIVMFLAHNSAKHICTKIGTLRQSRAVRVRVSEMSGDITLFSIYERLKKTATVLDEHEEALRGKLSLVTLEQQSQM